MPPTSAMVQGFHPHGSTTNGGLSFIDQFVDQEFPEQMVGQEASAFLYGEQYISAAAYHATDVCEGGAALIDGRACVESVGIGRCEGGELPLPPH